MENLLVKKLEGRNPMKRREFLRTCTAGLIAGGGSLPVVAMAGAEPAKRDIDPDKFCKTAHKYFIPGKLTCCESILMAGCEALGIQSDLVPDIALGLAGGIGLQGETCGVLSGCALVLSLAVAEREKEYPKKKMRTLQAVGRVHKAFKERLGRTDCRSLSGLDLTTPEGRKKLEGGVKEQVCDKYVRAGSELLAKELQAL
jgi:C_GCAxxG_C_C family probable redox protein